VSIYEVLFSRMCADVWCLVRRMRLGRLGMWRIRLAYWCSGDVGEAGVLVCGDAGRELSCGAVDPQLCMYLSLSGVLYVLLCCIDFRHDFS